MELITHAIPKSLKKFRICPLGDIQWSGEHGPTAKEHLKRHIGDCLDNDGFFFGVGDFTDMLSPSNRAALRGTRLYDTALRAIWDKARENAEEVYEKFLKDTTGRWWGHVEGHHFYEYEGEHTDEIIGDKLKSTFLGTSAFVRIPSADLTVYLNHGNGGGVLPGSGLNPLYHKEAGMPGADIYMVGHNTKLATARLSRPFPVWGKKRKDHSLRHRDVLLVNCGGFSKSNVVGHCVLCRPRGDYAEQAGYTPSPLAAPYITIDLNADPEHPQRMRASI